MQIRQATVADLSTLNELAAQMYTTDAVLHPLPAGAMERSLQESLRPHSHLRLWLLEEAGLVVGYGIAVDFWLNEYGPMLYLDELFLRADQRGKGYGQAYIAKMEQFAAEQGYAGLTMYVSPHNERAARLYQRLGYNNLDYRIMYKEI